jgi:methyl-accepting chemotaxis protein
MDENGHGTSRLDRIEGVIERLAGDHLKFRDEHKSLLTSQVLITDSMQKLIAAMETFSGQFEEMAVTVRGVIESQRQLTDSQKELVESQKELSEMQKHTDERMNALIAVVDDLIRRRPN